MIADRFEIPALKRLATLKSVEYIRWWGYELLSNDFEKVVELVRAAYSGGDATSEIREAIVARLVALRVVADRERLEGFRDVMTTCPGFAFDLMAALSCRMPRLNTGLSSSDWAAAYGCPGCDKRNYLELFGDDSACGYLQCIFCDREWSEEQWMSYPIV